MEAVSNVEAKEPVQSSHQAAVTAQLKENTKTEDDSLTSNTVHKAEQDALSAVFSAANKSNIPVYASEGGASNLYNNWHQHSNHQHHYATNPPSSASYVYPAGTQYTQHRMVYSHPATGAAYAHQDQYSYSPTQGRATLTYAHEPPHTRSAAGAARYSSADYHPSQYTAGTAQFPMQQTGYQIATTHPDSRYQSFSSYVAAHDQPNQPNTPGPGAQLSRHDSQSSVDYDADISLQAEVADSLTKMAKMAHSENIDKAEIIKSSPASENLSSGEFSQKPNKSFVAMIAEVILQSKTQALTVNAIYEGIQNNYSYYAHTSNIAWKNSVRHNLSLNKCFERKVPDDKDPRQVKGAKWTLTEIGRRVFEKFCFEKNPDTTRRRSRNAILAVERELAAEKRDQIKREEAMSGSYPGDRRDSMSSLSSVEGERRGSNESLASTVSQ